MAITFTKGHGTENDFILVDDPDGDLTLSAQVVARLCDRRRGLGADGLIRVVRTAKLGDPAVDLAAAPDGGPEWFMDYRNADGGAVQMCGNGVRVFTAHLLARGWIDLPDGGEVPVGTRDGIKTVRRGGGRFGVDLGPWFLPGGAAAIAAGSDTEISVPAGLQAPSLLTGLPGLSVNTGNPHVVVALPSVDLLEALDLTRPPGADPLPDEGTNVEFVVPMHDSLAESGHLRMRVYERGVGETRSCGTGAVAAVLAARAWAGPDAPVRWTVDVPGGRLEIELPLDDAALASGRCAVLSGPAVLVADGQLLDVSATS